MSISVPISHPKMALEEHTPLLLISKPFDENEAQQDFWEDIVKGAERFIKPIYKQQNIRRCGNGKKEETLCKRDEENIEDEERAGGDLLP
jgi:hypothetical protein